MPLDALSTEYWKPLSKSLSKNNFGNRRSSRCLCLFLCFRGLFMACFVKSGSKGLGCSKPTSIPPQLAEELKEESYVACIRIGRGSSGDIVQDVQIFPQSNPKQSAIGSIMEIACPSQRGASHTVDNVGKECVRTSVALILSATVTITTLEHNIFSAEHPSTGLVPRFASSTPPGV